MYYTSTNISELEAYNSQVGLLIGLVAPPYKWAQVITHKGGGLYAIQKHDVHTSVDFDEIESLEGWFNEL
jgi:hypothetical protein